MRAGLLRHRLAFDELVEIEDTTGAPVWTFVERFRVWGSITPGEGRQVFSGDQVIGTTDSKIVVRWRPTTEQVLSTWRAQRVDRFTGMRKGPMYRLYPPNTLDLRNIEIDIPAQSGAIGG